MSALNQKYDDIGLQAPSATYLWPGLPQMWRLLVRIGWLES
jgi:hypothetical protein